MMKAMVFAAGVGRRLHPLTGHTPKALVAVGGYPMIWHVLNKLRRAGVTRVVVNIHHHAGQMRAYLGGLRLQGLSIDLSDESGQLMDTGGGLLKASPFLEGDHPFFLYNVDVLSDISLVHMLEQHMRRRPLATLAVSRRLTSRYLLWHEGRLAGWENSSTGRCLVAGDPGGGEPEAMAFSGIHIVEPRIFPLISEQGPFAIRDLYLRLATEHPIMPYVHDHRYWADMGSPEKLENARQMYQHSPQRFD